jgi:hypothetical protein
MMHISREQFLQEMQLREAIRSIIFQIEKDHLAESKVGLLQEHKLRRFIRGYLTEAKVADKVPHASTGINVLEDLLKKVLPILEDGFKSLTTSADQRQSFRSHILNAMMRSISPPRALKQAEIEYLLGTVPSGPIDQMDDDMFQQNMDLVGDDGELEELALKLGGDDGPVDPRTDLDGDGIPDEEDAFIDIDGDGEEDPRAEFAQGLESMDLTGRNVAYDAYQKIEKQTLEAYDLLSNDADRQIFYNYLVTNVKLYFDKYESEIAPHVQEPTTPEYEDQVSQQMDLTMASGGDMPADGTEQGAGAIPGLD